MGSQCCKPSPEEKTPKFEKLKAEKIKGDVAPPPPKPKPLPPNAVMMSTKIQAWWRGTLLRRTLLHAALQAWVIQCWWRQTQAKQMQKQRQELLDFYLCEVRAAVRLQSWYRMCRARRRYCTLLSAAHIIQSFWRLRKSHTRYLLNGIYEITSGQLRLQMDVLFGPQICRITDCIPFPIKN
ncbi:IQ domain-containing protein F5-like [Ochotona princeps]|uniref:IQ domain-containing protein F5-like n=1 Tax=Ochotona princeps TaxID=9978 RepID=UPI00271453B1|nr:IQ domain-containing protein F5-like [Ochotona princeps]